MLSGRPVARHVGADGVGESVGPDKGPPCSCEGTCTLVGGDLGLWAWGWEFLPPCWDRVVRPKNTVLAPQCSSTLDTQCVRGSCWRRFVPASTSIALICGQGGRRGSRNLSDRVTVTLSLTIKQTPQSVVLLLFSFIFAKCSAPRRTLAGLACRGWALDAS